MQPDNRISIALLSCRMRWLLQERQKKNGFHPGKPYLVAAKTGMPPCGRFLPPLIAVLLPFIAEERFLLHHETIIMQYAARGKAGPASRRRVYAQLRTSIRANTDMLFRCC